MATFGCPFELLYDKHDFFRVSVCGARYKTRPGLTYHYTHFHNSVPGETEATVPSPKPSTDSGIVVYLHTQFPLHSSSTAVHQVSSSHNMQKHRCTLYFSDLFEYFWHVRLSISTLYMRLSFHILSRSSTFAIIHLPSYFCGAAVSPVSATDQSCHVQQPPNDTNSSLLSSPVTLWNGSAVSVPPSVTISVFRSSPNEDDLVKSNSMSVRPYLFRPILI